MIEIDQTTVRLTNLTIMARLLTTEELLGLRKIITKELSKRRKVNGEGETKNDIM